jgi:hypothetical protein
MPLTFIAGRVRFARKPYTSSAARSPVHGREKSTAKILNAIDSPVFSGKFKLLLVKSKINAFDRPIIATSGYYCCSGDR